MSFFFQTLAPAHKPLPTLRILTNPAFWYWAGILIAVSLFLNSIVSGGPVWDEPFEFDKLNLQLSFARDVLFGSTDWTFRSFPGDSAFYGIGTVFPAYVLSYLIDIMWLNGTTHTWEHSYSL